LIECRTARIASSRTIRDPEAVTTPSPAPPVVVEAWCIGVERMSRRTLNRFTKEIFSILSSNGP
jgi:hypothetical protein